MSEPIAADRRPPVFGAAVVLVVGAAAILAAWGFQLIGGYVPCALCLEQRIPYYLGLPLALFSLAASLARMPRAIPRILLLLVAITFAYGLYLAIYQSGAEWRFWAGPADCGGGGATTSNAANLMAQLQHTRVVSCTEASFRLLGLSFAGWNGVSTAILVVASLFGALAGRKREPHLSPRRA